MSFSNYLEGKLLDEAFGATDFTAPATLYIALGTDTTPSDSTFTEFTIGVGSYARKSVTNDKTTWTTAGAGGGSVSNAIVITFATASADWGTAKCFAVYDASTAGNMLGWGTLSVNKIISNGDTPSFGIGTLTITLD